jgi:hypothetical protein
LLIYAFANFPRLFVDWEIACPVAQYRGAPRVRYNIWRIERPLPYYIVSRETFVLKSLCITEFDHSIELQTITVIKQIAQGNLEKQLIMKDETQPDI